MRSRSIRIVLVLASLAATAAAAVAGAWWRADRFLAGASANRSGDGEYSVEIAPTVELGRGAADGTAWITASMELRDGGRAGGQEMIATAGGLVPARDGARTRPYTTRDGMAGVELTAAAPLGDRLVIGDAEGGLTLVDGGRATAVRIQLPRPGPVADLAPAGAVVYALFTGMGVVAFDGRRAVDVSRGSRPIAAALAEASAVCAGSGPLSGLAVATRGGAIYEERDGSLARLDLTVPDGPVTALTRGPDGELYAGTPFALHRLDGGLVRVLARDLFVSAILAADAGLFVATFDDGIRILDAETGRERARYLAGRPVHRLRLIDGHVVAFAPGGPFRYTGGQFVADPAPAAERALRGPHVTALAHDGAGSLWVGTFEQGIDVLDSELRPLRHLPDGNRSDLDARDDQVNALAFHGPSREMIAATVHGADRYGAAGPRILALDEPAAGRRTGPAPPPPDAIAAIAFSRSGQAFAGARGVHLVEGARLRTLYAFHGLANNHVYSLAVRDEASGERLYAGTLAGVSMIDLPRAGDPDAAPRVISSVGAGAGGLRAGWVTALAAAPEGIYAGTYGGGVQLLLPAARPLDPLTVEDVSAGATFHVNQGALALDGGTLFVGTLELGLLAYDRDRRTWRALPRHSRLLPSQNVSALLADRDALLVGTTAGLVRIPRSLLEQALVPLKPEGSS